MDLSKRRCRKCKEVKEVADFYNQRRKGEHKICKVCCRLTKKKYRENNKEQVRAERRRYREKYENREKINAYNNSPKVKFLRYKKDADRRGRDFELELELFESLMNAKCTYCGEEGNMGVDRIDSSKGYTSRNCAPCCSKCNYSKQSLSVEEFEELIIKIAKHRNLF